MNATSYYLQTCRLVIQADPGNQSSCQDIFRFLPMLRNSLSCTVCEKLLNDPYTPEETSCQHHVCAGCLEGEKALRCSWCKDYSKYVENPQLRILLQSYKSLCNYIKVTQLYQLLRANKEFGNQIQEIIGEVDSGLTASPYNPHAATSPVPGLTQTLSALNNKAEEEIEKGEEGLGRVSSVDSIPMHTTVRIKSSVDATTGGGDGVPEGGDDVYMDDEHETSSDQDGRWFCVTSRGQLIPEQSTSTRRGQLIPKESTSPLNLSPIKQELGTDLNHSPFSITSTQSPFSSSNTPHSPSGTPHSPLSPTSTTHPHRSPRRLRKDRPSPLVVSSLTSARIKDEMFTSPNVKVENENFCVDQKVDEEVSFRISSPCVSKALFLDTNSTIQDYAKDIIASRSDTPSPPNSSRYLNLKENGQRMKITQSYILKPRQGSGDSNSKQHPQIELAQNSAASSRVPIMLARSIEDNNQHNNGESLLRPLIQEEDEGVDPLEASSSPITSTGKGKKGDEGKGGEKQGCRCGNATSTPGKLTCCGQRCPCYVNKFACLSCKCKGCNNPNLPGGGKILPYLDIAMNSKNSKLHSYRGGSNKAAINIMTTGSSSSRGSGGSGNTTWTTTSSTTGGGVVGTRGRVGTTTSTNNTLSSGKLSVSGSNVAVSGSNIAVSGSNIAVSGSNIVLPGSRMVLGGTSSHSSSSGKTSSSFVQIPSSSHSFNSIATVDINKIPVVNLSTSNAIRTLLSPADVKRLMKCSSSTPTTVNVVSSGSPLSTVTIPISSLTGGTGTGLKLTGGSGTGLKLRPVHQIQGKDVKYQTIRVRGPPYSRVPLNGKVGHVRLQTVSLVTLLKNQKNIQVVRPESEDTENNPTS